MYYVVYHQSNITKHHKTMVGVFLMEKDAKNFMDNSTITTLEVVSVDAGDVWKYWNGIRETAFK
jgi:hypothetical protein